MIIDVTGIRDGTGPARLLDLVEGRSKQALKTWLAVGRTREPTEEQLEGARRGLSESLIRTRIVR